MKGIATITIVLAFLAAMASIFAEHAAAEPNVTVYESPT